MIDLNSLPKEIRDLIELKEATDMTFSRFVDEDYTEILWNVLAERANPEVEHSFIASCYGTQGCHCAGTKITTKRGLVDIESVIAGDEVWTRSGWRKCIPIRKGIQRTLKVKLHNHQEFRMTEDHKMWTRRGVVRAGDLVSGDIFICGDVRWSDVWNDDSERAAVVAMMLADGHMDEIYCEKDNYVKKRVRFYKSDDSLRAFFKKMLKKHFGAVAVGEYADKGTCGVRVVCVQRESVFDSLVEAGVPIGKKSNIVKIPDWVIVSDAAMNGFLAGYFACDGSFYNKGVEISTTSEQMSVQLQSWLQSRGCVVSVLKREREYPCSDVYRIMLRQYDSLKLWVDNVPNLSLKKKVFLRDVDDVQWVKYSDEIVEGWWEKKYSGWSYQQIADWSGVVYSVVWLAMNKFKSGIRGRRLVRRNGSVDLLLAVESVESCCDEVVFDLHVKDVHEYLANGLISSNSGKSMLAIALCCFLDPNFSVDNIYFDYNDLVYNRDRLKPNTAVLIDEQSQSYGLDSHRVMIILASLKEQLRKKSIHFIFCSPTLYEEYKSSMYLFETMFIDYENQESYAALKTRDGLTLGHVRVPYPLKILEDGRTLASPSLITAYQDKKDRHLEKVLGRQGVDIFEDRANKIMKNSLFKKAETIYKFKMGYIPQSTVVQIINKIYPEFNAGVVPLEIAGRIKLNKELSGEWEVSGQASKRDRRTAVPQRRMNKPTR